MYKKEKMRTLFEELFFEQVDMAKKLFPNRFFSPLNEEKMSKSFK